MPRRLRAAAKRLLSRRGLVVLLLLVTWEVVKDRFAGWANARIDEQSVPIMEFFWPYLQEVAIAPLGYTVAFAIVILLVMFGHAYFTEAQEQVFTEPASRFEDDPGSEQVPDLEMSSAAFQVAGLYESKSVGNKEVDRLTDALAEIRQLAHYGRITIWGREITSSNTALGVRSPIPKDYWRSKELNPVLLIESNPDAVEKHTIIDGAAMGKAVNSPDYTDTYVNSRELSRELNRKIVVETVQKSRQTVDIAANKLPTRGHMSFAHSLDRVPSKIETMLVCTSEDGGYSVDDTIHGDLGLKSTMTERNVTIYIHGIGLHIPHKYKPATWIVLDVNKWNLRINIYE